MSESTPAELPRFSEVIREHSRDAHREAEASRFVTALMTGTAEKSAYAMLATQHFYIYEALEAVAETLREDPVAGQFITENLYRVPSLREDLAALIGPHWRETTTPLPATRTYADRIRETADWPGGYVAHHYTRYLGDLSGGQAVRSRLARHYGIDGDGARFYQFDAISKPKLFKDQYRAKLDAATWDADERMRIVDEVRAAFRLNSAVFAELAHAVSSRPSA